MIKENQLLNRIMKAVTGAPVEAVAPPPAVEAPVEEAPTAMGSEIALMRFQADAELATAAAALADMTSKFEGAQAQLEALLAAQAEAVLQAAAAKFAARKEQVTAAIGTEKAEGLMLATQGLDDAAFNAVVSALAGSVDKEASAGLFVEAGVAAAADTTKIVAESPEMKILRQKFPDAK